MCLVLFALDAHPRYSLVVAANRDEWFDRPTDGAHFWPDNRALLAGRDRQQEGTWLGLTRGGRFSALTNYRAPDEQRPNAPSRGQLVSAFLSSADAPATYLGNLTCVGGDYNGYNLLAGRVNSVGSGDSGCELIYQSNRAADLQPVAAGVHGLSNHLLDTAWPKVVRGRANLSAAISTDHIDATTLFSILNDSAEADAESLPVTGVSAEWERALSATHIHAVARQSTDGDRNYGTRSATVILVERAGGVSFSERTFGIDGTVTRVHTERFTLTAPP